MTAENLTLVSLWVHIPLVTAWIGLVLWDALAMLAPDLQVAQRARLVTWSRPFVLAAIPLILATGIWQTIHNPYTQITSLASLESLRERTAYGSALFWKHGFVLATFALTVAVRFVLAPRLLAQAVAAPAGSIAPPVHQLQRALQQLTLVNAGLCLGALIFDTLMVWALH